MRPSPIHTDYLYLPRRKKLSLFDHVTTLERRLADCFWGALAVLQGSRSVLCYIRFYCAIYLKTKKPWGSKDLFALSLFSSTFPAADEIYYAFRSRCVTFLPFNSWVPDTRTHRTIMSFLIPFLFLLAGNRVLFSNKLKSCHGDFFLAFDIQQKIEWNMNVDICAIQSFLKMRLRESMIWLFKP